MSVRASADPPVSGEKPRWLRAVARTIEATATAGLLGALAASLAGGNARGAEPRRLAFFDDDVFIRAPVSVDGIVRYFIVDTGSSRTSIDRRPAALLGAPLRSVRQTTSSGDTVAEEFRAPALAIGGDPIALGTVLASDLTLAREISGQECDGILGMDVLARYVVEIDFARREITLDSTPPQLNGEANSLALSTTDGVPVLNSSGAPALRLLIDTAANVSLSFDDEDWNRLLPPEAIAHTAHTLFATVDNRTVETATARLGAIRIGAGAYRELLCTRIATAAVSSVGLPFLRRHRVIADFPRQMLYLIPVGEVREEKDMSGLHLLRRENAVTVAAVDAGSPAAKAGVSPGDIILRLDDIDVSGLTMQTIRDQLKAEDGASRTLTLRRNATELSVGFILRRQV